MCIRDRCDFIRYTATGASIWVNLKLRYLKEIGNKHLVLGPVSYTHLAEGHRQGGTPGDRSAAWYEGLLGIMGQS